MRKYIQDSCKELLETLNDKGFVTNKNGLLTKRKVDKDITQEIYCQITSYLDIIIHFNIYSKKVRQWLKETYQAQNNIGVVGMDSQLGYMTKQGLWKSWEIGKSEIAKDKFNKEAKR